MAEGKWVSDLTPGMPVEDAAARVLQIRLQAASEHLEPALTNADKDLEYVHQLRVSTRRADAALRIFRDSLPGKVYKRARRDLRGLRRAAGAARDWDVFLIELAARHRASAPGWDFLIGYALGQRLAAQGKLLEVGASVQGDFAGMHREVVQAIRPAADTKPVTFLELARPALAKLLEDLHQAAQGDLEDYANLHQVRILGKKLRYAMEIFVDCFAPTFRESLYPQVEAMQEILGRANDSHVAGERLAEVRGALRRRQPAAWKRYQPALTSLARYHQRRLPQERRRFLEWWKEWQRSGTETAFATLLKHPELDLEAPSAPGDALAH
jgi:CHAD domain-containing protein